MPGSDIKPFSHLRGTGESEQLAYGMRHGHRAWRQHGVLGTLYLYWQERWDWLKFRDHSSPATVCEVPYGGHWEVENTCLPWRRFLANLTFFSYSTCLLFPVYFQVFAYVAPSTQNTLFIPLLLGLLSVAMKAAYCIILDLSTQIWTVPRNVQCTACTTVQRGFDCHLTHFSYLWVAHSHLSFQLRSLPFLLLFFFLSSLLPSLSSCLSQLLSSYYVSGPVLEVGYKAEYIWEQNRPVQVELTFLCSILGFPCVDQLVKNLPAIWETWVQSLTWEDPLEKG